MHQSAMHAHTHAARLRYFAPYSLRERLCTMLSWTTALNWSMIMRVSACAVDRNARVTRHTIVSIRAITCYSRRINSSFRFFSPFSMHAETLRSALARLLARRAAWTLCTVCRAEVSMWDVLAGCGADLAPTNAPACQRECYWKCSVVLKFRVILGAVTAAAVHWFLESTLCALGGY